MAESTGTSCTSNILDDMRLACLPHRFVTPPENTLVSVLSRLMIMCLCHVVRQCCDMVPSSVPLHSLDEDALPSTSGPHHQGRVPRPDCHIQQERVPAGGGQPRV
jgi:hypothetical protein